MICRFNYILIGCLLIGSAVVAQLPEECNEIEEPRRFILCYSNEELEQVDVCRCSHLVVPLTVNTTQNNNGSIALDEASEELLRASNSASGGRLRRILSLAVATEDFSSTTSAQLIASSVLRMIDDLLIEGIEINWQLPSTDENSKKDKANLVLFMKELYATLQEKVIVTGTPSPSSDLNGTSAEVNQEIDAMRPLVILRLPTSPELLVKGFDLKPLARSVDLFVVATHNMSDASNVTYHHSRLMGLSDILNTDSVLDLVVSLGVPAERLIAAVPTFALQFRLRNNQENLPGSPVIHEPTEISRETLCSILSTGNWTIERDDDLTGMYAYSEEGDWIAFDDELASQIKAKYMLLRDIAGVAIMPSNTAATEPMQTTDECNQPKMERIYYEQFLVQELGQRTRRQLAKSLQNDLSSAASTLSSPIYNERIRPSPYRIVRIVSRSGESSVMRQSLESSLQCSRQGYYRHPEDCGRFYRCVKFDQYIDDFTIFEYDCPEGLVFDERWEVCTWPSQAAPCGGSSEIRPVPMNKFVCPGEGYFADPENCRWFFACRDYAKDGVTYTQYEFRCPFGLLFDEENLLCNWPWLVPKCSSTGSITSSSNTDAVKYREDKKISSIPIGNPGYLGGKLVTGEGLYKDPRPTFYGEAVVSSGCIDCSSPGLVVTDPNSSTYQGPPTGKQTKLVLAIPAATIAGETEPVRIIVASSTGSLPNETPSSYGGYETATSSNWNTSPDSSTFYGAQKSQDISNLNGYKGSSVNNRAPTSYFTADSNRPSAPTIYYNSPSSFGASDFSKHSSYSNSNEPQDSGSYKPKDSSGSYVPSYGSYGSQGPSGPDGPKGPSGPDGPKGLSGSDGPKGPSGSSGQGGYKDTYNSYGSSGSYGSQSSYGSSGSSDSYRSQDSSSLLGSYGSQSSSDSDRPTAYKSSGSYATQQQSSYEPKGFPGSYKATEVYDSSSSQGSFGSYGSQLYPGSQSNSDSQKWQDSSDSYRTQNSYGSQVSNSFKSQESIGSYSSQGYSGTQSSPDSVNSQGSTKSYGSHGQSGSKSSSDSHKSQESTGLYGSQGYSGSKSSSDSQKSQESTGSYGSQVYSASQSSSDSLNSQGSTKSYGSQRYSGSQSSLDSYKSHESTGSYSSDYESQSQSDSQKSQESTGSYGSQEYSGSQSSSSSEKSHGSTGSYGSQGYSGSQSSSDSQKSQESTGSYGSQVYSASQSSSDSLNSQGSTKSYGSQEYSGSQSSSSSEKSHGSTGSYGSQEYSGSHSSTDSHKWHDSSDSYVTQTSYGSQGSSNSYKSHEPIDSYGSQGSVGTHSKQDSHKWQGSSDSLGTQGSYGLQGYSGSYESQGSSGSYNSPGSYGSYSAQGNTRSQDSSDSYGTQGSYNLQGSYGSYGSEGSSGSKAASHGSYKSQSSSEPSTISPTSLEIKSSSGCSGSSDSHESSGSLVIAGSIELSGLKEQKKPLDTYATVPGSTTVAEIKETTNLDVQTQPSKVASSHGSSSSYANNAEVVRTTSYNRNNKNSYDQQTYDGGKQKVNVETSSDYLDSSSGAQSVTSKVVEPQPQEEEKNSNSTSYYDRLPHEEESTTKESTAKTYASTLGSTNGGYKQNGYRGAGGRGVGESTGTHGTGGIRGKGGNRGSYRNDGLAGARGSPGTGGRPGTGGTGGSPGTGGRPGTGGTRGSPGTGGKGGIGGIGGNGGTGGTGGRGGIGGTGGTGGIGATGYAGPAGIGATGYAGPDYNPAWDGPSGDVYSKRQPSPSSSNSGYSNDYESSSRFGDNTFGMKESTKSRPKYNPTLGSGSKSFAGIKSATNKNQADGKEKLRNEESHTTSANKGLSKTPVRNDSTTRGSSSSKSSLSGSSNRDPTNSFSANNAGVNRYTEKQVTVKVPSTNKAALLDKWSNPYSAGKVDSSTKLPITDQVLSIGSSDKSTVPESSSSTKGSQSNGNRRIKGNYQSKSKTETENQELGSKKADSTSELQSYTSNKELTSKKPAGSEFGQRYLERVRSDQAKNETLGPEVCVRAGLFRHPSDCQKFYECYWDRWIHQYTVHIFKCPVHLIYDDYITACNWPLDGPACVPHEAVKLYAQLPGAV